MDKVKVIAQLHQVLEQFDLSRQAKDTLADTFLQVIDLAVEGINPDMTLWLKKSEYNQYEAQLRNDLVAKTDYNATLKTLVTNSSLATTLANYTTLTKLSEETAKLVTLTAYNTKIAELTNKFNNYELTTDHANDVTAINNNIAKKLDASEIENYYDKTTVDSKLSEKVSQIAYDLEKQSFATKSDISNMATTTDLDGYVTRAYVDTLVIPTSTLDKINLNDSDGNAKDAMTLIKELITALTNVGLASGYGQ